MSEKSGAGLPLVAFRLPPDVERSYDEFALAHQLRVVRNILLLLQILKGFVAGD